MRRISLICVLLALVACQKNQVTVPCEGSTVRLEVISPELVHVSVSPDGKFSGRKSLVVLPQKGCADFQVAKEAGEVSLETSALKVVVHKADGTIHFFRADGTPLATDGRAAFQPVEV